MSAFVLRIIAFITMLIDHVAAVYSQEFTAVDPWLYTACRTVGRLAFPLFVFGIAEGARHTSSGKKYFLRMLLFSFISQIPFSLMIGVRDPTGCLSLFGKSIGYSTELSVMVTLTLGLTICLAIKEKNYSAGAFALTAAYVVEKSVGMDYGLTGVLFIVAVYFAGEKKLNRFLVMLAFPFLFYSSPVLTAVREMASTHVLTLSPNVLYCLAMCVPAVLTLFYNGRRGTKTGLWGYAFYPAHMTLILLSYLAVKL